MQRLSITASLNNNTLQFEEAAYLRLERYLAEASRTLEGNPDKTEILADLEQAVADQCRKRLRPDQSVVTQAELEPALLEIGSVEVPDATGGTDRMARDAVPRLQQVSEGAWISGVCQGLARYLRLDVVLVRLAAVLLLLFTGGAMILVYAVLMLLLPYAPLEPGGEPVRNVPAKSRELVELLRAKLSAATS